jgi:hypothetical protein
MLYKYELEYAMNTTMSLVERHTDLPKSARKPYTTPFFRYESAHILKALYHRDIQSLQAWIKRAAEEIRGQRPGSWVTVSSMYGPVGTLFAKNGEVPSNGLYNICSLERPVSPILCTHQV